MPLIAAQAFPPLLQHLQEHDTAFPLFISFTTLWKTPSLTLDSIVMVSYFSES